MFSNMGYLVLGLSSGYILTSALFFCFPLILKRKRIFASQLFNQALEGKKILRMSHRGSPRYGTQNTIEAFRRVFHISDVLEMDVCQTADKILVVHHDESLLRSCGVNRLITECKYEQLPKYQDQIKLDFSSERFFPTNNEKIPSLESVFQIFQGIPMNIQLKTPTLSAIKQFIRLIHQYDRQDITVIGIRSHQNHLIAQHYYNLVKELNQQQPKNAKILQFMNDKTVMKVYLAYIFGLLPFINIKEASMQLPVYSKQFQQWLVERSRTNNQSEFKLKISCKLLRFMNFISKPLIWHFKKRGIMTYGWVCNTQQSLERANWMGVQGIMSDEPFLLDQFVKQQKENKKQQ